MFVIPVNERILKNIAELDRFRGSWGGGVVSAPPEAMTRLRDASRVQSVAASCRMAGIRLTDGEVDEVLRFPDAPHRERESILGLAAAWDWRPSVSDGFLDATLLGTLNAKVLGDLSPDPEPSPWRDRHASREAFYSDGTAMGRVLPTLPPRMLPEKMEQTLGWLEQELGTEDQHPLLVVGTFTLAVFAAHPFDRGNGRTVRLIAEHLVERVGYEHVRHASLALEFEETRDAYYEAFDASETRLWVGEADLEPWLTYFLETLRAQAERLKRTIARENRVLNLTALQRQVLSALREHGSADAALLLEATGANRHTLKDNMRRLVGMGLVDKTGERRTTRYRLGRGAAAIDH